MSYTLKPTDEAARENAAAAYVTQPISVQRVGIGVGIGAVILFSIAGLPSWSRHRRPLPTHDASSPPHSMLCSRDLWHTFADLRETVDRVTHQRPIYPTTEQLFERLIAVGHWQRAVLFAHDASLEELQSAGLTDGELFTQRQHRLGPELKTDYLSWELALLDEQGCLVGHTFFTVPSLEVESYFDEAQGVSYPILDQRLPDWPRIAVFNRPPAEAQSDG